MQLRRYRNTIETVIFFVDFARSSQWWTPPRVQGNVLREIFHVKKCSTPKKKETNSSNNVDGAPPGFGLYFWWTKKTCFFSVTNTGALHKPPVTPLGVQFLTLRIRYFFQQTWFRSKPKVCKKKSHCSDKMLGGGFAPTHLRNISQIGSSTQVEVNKKYLKKYLNPSSPLLAFFTRSGRGGMPRAAIIPKAVLADKFRTRS